jgi:hypothetical protein
VIDNPLDITIKSELAEFLGGKDNDELNALALELGSEAILQRVFASMKRDFDPENGPDEEVVVHWDILSPDGQHHHRELIASPVRCDYSSELEHEPDVTVRVGITTFIRIVAGLVRGKDELRKGRVKLKGDLLLATSIEYWFLQ